MASSPYCSGGELTRLARALAANAVRKQKAASATPRDAPGIHGAVRVHEGRLRGAREGERRSVGHAGLRPPATKPHTPARNEPAASAIFRRSSHLSASSRSIAPSETQSWTWRVRWSRSSATANSVNNPTRLTISSPAVRPDLPRSTQPTSPRPTSRTRVPQPDSLPLSRSAAVG
jgi:hypothetical protein